MKPLGCVVGELFKGAQDDVLIVAPFMRTSSLVRLLDCVKQDVKTTIVTRWRPVDILAGASDLEVFDISQKQQHIDLYLRNDLHAKLFAADKKCLVGSANVTATGLGWRTPANFELLIPASRLEPYIVEFEELLLEGSIKATREHQRQLQLLINSLQELSSPSIPVANLETASFSLPPNWIPQTMNPDELFLIYSDEDQNDFDPTTAKVMLDELKPFGLPPNLVEEDFKAWIASLISQVPLVSFVNQDIKDHGEISEAQLRNLLAKIGVDTNKHSSRSVMQVLERWLTYFLSSDYEAIQDSIKLIKAKKL